PISPEKSQVTPRSGLGGLVVMWSLIGLALGGAWYYQALWWPYVAARIGSEPPATKPPARPVPVRVAPVVKRDLPEYLTGLGTVTAYKTVTIRSRVDGELVKVAFQEGQIVCEGDLLAEVDPRPYRAQLDQAEGTLARDEATLKLARLTLARGEELLKTKSIAPQQVDEEAAQVQVMEGTVQADKGLVENAQLQLTYCRIVSPISGRIGLRLVDQGNMVHANDVAGLAVITQLQPISIVFPVPQDHIPRVQRQMNAGRELVVEAYNRDFKTRLAVGKLTAIDNQVDATTGTLRFKADFENQDHMLFPNQFVNIRLLIDTWKDSLIVPTAAVQRGPSGTFVYVLQADDTVDLRPIKVGHTEGSETLVQSGLEPGEMIVTDGLDKLKKDAKVTTSDKDQTTDAKPGSGDAPGPRLRPVPATPAVKSRS
ncbi:MAG: MdtA/MuxA family multidrug efflux RND transporter periplasmic adaptor subunit, partial [Planctomycetes bacterium]|nr:MdtA/MuxA family multidrug efflux RND transporter periplasmic adaptor subunit [Planctomycetota bacterium]